MIVTLGMPGHAFYGNELCPWHCARQRISIVESVGCIMRENVRVLLHQYTHLPDRGLTRRIYWAIVPVLHDPSRFWHLRLLVEWGLT